MSDLAPAEPPLVTPQQVLQGALLDSRQRWRALVNLAADLAFETDEWGRFTLITPEMALDWPAEELIGQPSAALLAESDGAGFDPFRVTASVRYRQAWIKRGDGSVACLTFWASPVRDSDGRVAGARGIGIDMTELDCRAACNAEALRRSEVVDHILRRIAREVVTSCMMGTALEAFADALGAEGVAVIVAPDDLTPGRVAYVHGTGADAIAGLAEHLPRPRDATPAPILGADGHKLLLTACQTRSGENAYLAAWRRIDARGWDPDDRKLIGSVARIVRMLLEREAIQQDMTRQARTDPLTGLLNRRAFLEEVGRRAARQDRDAEPGTLIFADLDHFKPVNDRLGHEAGDEVLRRTAALLRKTFRPSDLIARLGGDEFAIWLDNADHMTAAERAEYLRDAVPVDLAEITGPDLPLVTMSIGIASRDPTEAEPLDSLMRRADMAMYQVKRGGRGHWRVSLRKRR